MKHSHHVFSMLTMLLGVSATLSSCIDEDMSDCGKDYQIKYNLKLNTQINTVIDADLNLSEEQAIASNLKQALDGIFTDHAKDNDLSFFSGETLSHHEANPMDASSASYTIFLPRNNYENLSLANIGEATNVSITEPSILHSLALTQEKKDTIDSHNIGLFSSRLTIQEDDFDHDLQSTLYMANCASAVVIDKNNIQADDIFGFVKGMADEFLVKDSVYHYDNHTIVRAQRVADSDRHAALYAVSFPSRDSYYIGNNAKSSQESNAKMQQGSKGNAATRADESTPGIWEFHVIVKLNGKYTENILTFPNPLKAGNLKIAKVTLQPDGSFTSNSQSVGVSVKLDWKPGGSHDIEI